MLATKPSSVIPLSVRSHPPLSIDIVYQMCTPSSTSRVKFPSDLSLTQPQSLPFLDLIINFPIPKKFISLNSRVLTQ